MDSGQTTGFLLWSCMATTSYGPREFAYHAPTPKSTALYSIDSAHIDNNSGHQHAPKIPRKFRNIVILLKPLYDSAHSGQWTLHRIELGLWDLENVLSLHCLLSINIDISWWFPLVMLCWTIPNSLEKDVWVTCDKPLEIDSVVDYISADIRYDLLYSCPQSFEVPKYQSINAVSHITQMHTGKVLGKLYPI